VEKDQKINQELDIGHAPKMFTFEHISSQLFSYFLPTWFKGELGFLGLILDNVHLSKKIGYGQGMNYIMSHQVNTAGRDVFVMSTAQIA